MLLDSISFYFRDHLSSVEFNGKNDRNVWKKIEKAFYGACRPFMQRCVHQIHFKDFNRFLIAESEVLTEI